MKNSILNGLLLISTDGIQQYILLCSYVGYEVLPTDESEISWKKSY